jgi:HNH endonuclease
VKNRPRLTRARLRELLHYDKDTGEFRWLERVGNEVRLGPVAGTVLVRVQRRNYCAHQLAWLYETGRWGRPMIDHRDGDSTNNRWSNLRRATASQNNANRRLPPRRRPGRSAGSGMLNLQLNDFCNRRITRPADSTRRSSPDGRRPAACNDIGCIDAPW